MLDIPSEENLDILDSMIDKYQNIDLKEVKFEQKSEEDGIHSNMSLPIGMNTSRFNSKKSSTIPDSRLEMLKELSKSPHRHYPLKIADPSLKKLKLNQMVKAGPQRKEDSYSYRQISVNTRDVPNDRIFKNIQDFLPESARNVIHARSRSVLKKRLIIGDNS